MQRPFTLEQRPTKCYLTEIVHPLFGVIVKSESERGRAPVFPKRFTLFIATFFAVLSCCSIVGLYMTRTTINLSSCLVPLIGGAVMFIISYGYRLRDSRISEVCFGIGSMVAISNLFNVPMFIVGRLKPPFEDDTLAALDRWVGIEVPDVLAFQQSYPAAYNFVSACYDLLLPLILLSIIIPTIYRHGARVREYFIALILSGIIGFALFYYFPAAGWFDRYNIAPRPDQVFYLEMIKNVWSRETFEIDLRYRAGLVYFPSFHTILPILSLYALRRLPIALICGVPLTVLIILSTVTTGSHYPCDIYAGILVAFTSCFLAGRLEPWITGYVGTGSAMGHPN